MRRSYSVRLALGTLLTLTFIACGGRADDAEQRDAEQRDASPDGQQIDTGQTDTRQTDPAELPICLRDGPFVADGTIPVQPEGGEAADGGDAHEVAALRWADHEECERFVLDLADREGDPARAAGNVRAEVLREMGVVRIALRDVPQVERDATDATFDGSLANAAYAMWSGDGRWVDVDLHLTGRAEASVAVLSDPARVVVDLRPGGGPVPVPAARGTRVVVLQPRPGPAAYPLTVRGYARHFEANVVARLEQDGRDVRETFTTATSWADAWGHYTLTFEDGPAGPVRLHVGEHSARDGSWQGVAVELEMENGG